MPREKNRHRDRRSLSHSSDSSYRSYEKRSVKSKHKRRSRSRGRSDTSSRKRRSSSRSRQKRRSYSRSSSRDRYESKSRRRSRSKSKPKKSRRSLVTRDRSLSRSSSRSRSKHSKKKHKTRRRTPSRSRSSSVEIERAIINKNVNLDDTDVKIAKAIKAAEAAGMTMTKIPTYEILKEVPIKEDMPTINDRNLLEEINSDSFVQKSFTSSKSKKKQNIVIDLNTDTIMVPEAEIPKDDSIINFSVIPSEEELRDMWVKKLYTYRKKMLKGEI